MPESLPLEACLYHLEEMTSEKAFPLQNSTAKWYHRTNWIDCIYSACLVIDHTTVIHAGVCSSIVRTAGPGHCNSQCSPIAPEQTSVQNMQLITMASKPQLAAFDIECNLCMCSIKFQADCDAWHPQTSDLQHRQAEDWQKLQDRSQWQQAMCLGRCCSPASVHPCKQHVCY